MDPVHFTDGFDRPDTIALGLDAPRLITVVTGALCAYAVMQAPLPFALRVCIAAVVAVLSAVLGWARYAGRPLLAWAWLALRFVLSPRAGGEAAAIVSAAVEVHPPVEAVAVAADAEGVGGPPEEDGVPVWAQWLRYESRRDAAPAGPAGLPDVVETARDAPLVVMIGERADGGGEEDADVPAQVAPADVRAEEADACATAAGLGSTSAEEPVAPIDERVVPPALGRAAEPLDAADVAADDAAAAGDVLHLPIARPDVAVMRAPQAPPAGESAYALDAAPPPVFVGAPRRVTFFSLNGGSGRTTLATEVACVLAARGRHMALDGTVRPLDVALLDLDLRSATVSVRLGIPQPTLADYVARGADSAHLDGCMVRHPSGVHALLGMPKPVAGGPGALEPARVAEIVHQLECDGAQFVVIDVTADLDAVTTWVLSAAHDVFVVLTPTASGVQDAYRTTAALRRLGLAQKLRYVVNRARGSVDLDEVMGDLGGRIAAVIPYDPAVEDAENQHRIVALDGGGAAAAALHDLAALLYPTLGSGAPRTRMSWLPWRRRAG